MERLTPFEIALSIICAGILVAGVANFIATFGLDWKEE